ncbi:NAD(P)/FAD-dependent oxidoreductase [Streptomyces sp. 900105755]
MEHGRRPRPRRSAERPCIRPPLSKGYLLGKEDRESIFVHPENWYREHDVDLMTGTRVTAVDAHTRQVELIGGRRMSYTKLLLATGSSPRRLTVPGADVDKRCTSAAWETASGSRPPSPPGARIVVVGGGWIGLETAAAARTAGALVTIPEHSELPLLNVLGREAAEVFADLQRDQGVVPRPHAAVERITGDGARADGVQLADGTRLPADAVVVGIGITPNVRLAEAAGL